MSRSPPYLAVSSSPITYQVGRLASASDGRYWILNNESPPRGYAYTDGADIEVVRAPQPGARLAPSSSPLILFSLNSQEPAIAFHRLLSPSIAFHRLQPPSISISGALQQNHTMDEAHTCLADRCDAQLLTCGHSPSCRGAWTTLLDGLTSLVDVASLLPSHILHEEARGLPPTLSFPSLIPFSHSPSLLSSPALLLSGAGAGSVLLL